MQGTYWLTVLPETSKLEAGIRKAVSGVDKGLKITPQFDISGAKRSGQQAGRDLQDGAESASRGSNFGRLFRLDGAREAGRKTGDDLNKGLNSVDVGSGLNKKIAQQMSDSDAAQVGARYGRTLGESVSSSARTGLGKLTGLLATYAGGAAIAGGLKSAVSAGMEFTTNLNTMGAVSGATAQELGQVSDKARQLGADTELPGVSAQTAAAAMVELAKGGFNVQQSMDAARGSLQLAGAAGVDAAQAATIQSDTLHTFSMNANEAGKAADILAGAANGSSVEINDIALSMAAGGSVAHGLGMNLADTASTIGMFANMGIKGSDAGTSMKTALLQLTSTSKPTVAAFQELGVQAFDAQGKFIGMRGLLDQLNAASKRMTTEQYQQAAATAFGTDGVRFAMLAAQQGAKGFDDMSAAVNRSGVAADVAAARTKGLPGAWANFKNQLDGVKLALYDKLQGPLATVLNYASNAIQRLMPVLERGADRLGAFFTQHAPAIKAFGEAIARAFSGGGAGAGGAMSELQRAASSLGPALDRIGPALSTIGRSVASIGSDTITSVAVPALHLLAGALGFIADHAAIIGPAIGAAVVAFAGLRTASAVGGNIRVLGESMRNIFTPVTLAATFAQTAALRAHTAALTQFAIAQGTATAEQSAGLLATIRQAAASTATAIAERARAVATGAVTAAQWLLDAALTANPIGLVIAAVVAVGAALWAFFTKTQLGRQIWETVWSAIKGAVTGFWNAAKTVWDSFTSALDNVGQKIGAFKNGLVDACNTVKDTVVGMWNAIGGIWDKIVSGAGKVGDFLKSAGGKVLGAVGLGGGAAGGQVLARHAGGGQISGPGTGTSDSILGFPAMVRVANGEWITNADDAAKNKPLLAMINAGVPVYEALRRIMPGFAGGGQVGPDVAAAESLVGHPYSQAERFDCSGTVARIINAATGTPGGGLMSTKNAAQWLAAKGFKPGTGGPGTISVGWYDHGPNPNDGHMAMTLSDGRHAESGGQHGNFLIGAGAAGADSAEFDQHMYLPTVYGEGAGSGGSASALGFGTSGGGGGSASALGAGTGGGGYRTASPDQLQASDRRVDAANTALKNADQSVQDNQYRVQQAQKHLDEVKAKGQDTADAQHRLDVANRELQDATERQTKAKDRAAKTQEDDNVLRTQGVKDAGAGSGQSGSGGGFGDLGKDLFGGVLESFGLDGSLFSNPLEWPTVKSLLAGVNFFGGLLAGGGSDAAGSTGSLASSMAGDGGGSGLGGLLGGITSGLGINGITDSSAQAQPPGAGDLNPAMASVSSAAAAPGVANADPAAAMNPRGGDDNRVIIENAGMSPTDVENKVTGVQNHRTRSTRIYRA